jgi:RNA methyltransferase, TrmH family
MCWRGLEPAHWIENDVKQITSAENPQFKALLKLTHSSRERRLAGYSLLDGVHLLQAYQSCLGEPEQIVVSSSGAESPEIQTLLQNFPNTTPLLLSDSLFKQLSSVATPTGIIAVIKTPRRETLPSALETCVMLEDVQDPGNLGSILRSCAAAGVRQIFLSKQTVNAWSPRVLRAAMGAHFSVEIYERVDLIALVRTYPGRVLVTQLHATRSVFNSDLTGKIALVFGNEGAGVSDALMQCATESIVIPMSAATESLNVAAAAAVCLFERVRQLQ